MEAPTATWRAGQASGEGELRPRKALPRRTNKAARRRQLRRRRLLGPGGGESQGPPTSSRTSGMRVVRRGGSRPLEGGRQPLHPGEAGQNLAATTGFLQRRTAARARHGTSGRNASKRAHSRAGATGCPRTPPTGAGGRTPAPWCHEGPPAHFGGAMLGPAGAQTSKQASMRRGPRTVTC